ncbi:MAG: AlpA family phage regulatory protein, partial [Proteobacteria bacterium]|nr:AlpA family phage regulatory protein [Pseudomonadota bacterium]
MTQLYRLPDVIRLTGLSKTSIYRLAREGKFPTPVRITESKSAWRPDEIQT